MTTPVIPNPSTPFLDQRTGLVRREWFLFLNSLITANVTSVGVSGANGIGVSGSPIVTAGTIALSLGAITPSSVAATGAVTGSNLSGTNTGDQTIALTGDVTGSGTGSFAATIAANAVTFAKLAANVLQTVSNSLSGDVALSNVANYFDGPSVAQGAAGTWFASGTVTVQDTNATSGIFFVKLWDGTTVIDSATTRGDTNSGFATVSLSGVLAAPVGNLRISVRDSTNAANANIKFNSSGNSKDSTITAFRIA